MHLIINIPYLFIHLTKAINKTIRIFNRLYIANVVYFDDLIFLLRIKDDLFNRRFNLLKKDY